MTDTANSEIKGVLRAEKFSSTWKIDRFFADCQKTGDYYQSPFFSTKCADTITKWFLEVYPKGQSDKSKDCVSLFLYFDSEIRMEIKVDFELSITSKLNSQPEEVLRKENHIFTGPSDNWGWDDFVKQSIIKDAMINDTLIISCEIVFRTTDQDVTKSFHDFDEWLDKNENMLGDYERLLQSDSFTDVTFNVQDKQINVHKAILSCRSPVFKAMFDHDMKENMQNSVEIMDMNYNVMEELFRFIYSGKVKNIEKIASELLIVADKYQVIELKVLCEKTLYDKLTVDNAVEYLKLTDTCDTIHLRRLIIKYIGAHHMEVVKKPGFVDLDKSVMYEILLTAAEKS